MDPIKLQQDLRNNQEDIQSYVRDLRNWTDQIKEKDKKLSSQKTDSLTESAQGKGDSGGSKGPDAPKVSSTTESGDSQRRKMANKCEPAEEVLKLKDAGNECLKKQKYEEAIKHYSAAMELDPNYHILPANRGMAYLKLKSFEKAEEDCGRAVALDPEYIKGYLRRGTARLELGKLQLARADYQKVLKLEPHNPQAKKSLEQIELEEAKQARLNQPTAQSAEKPAHLRSKKPLKKIPVVQVRNDDELESFIERGCISRTEDASEAYSNGTERSSPVQIEEVQTVTEKALNSEEEQSTSPKSVEEGTDTENAPKENKKGTPKAEPTQIAATPPMALPAAPRSSYEFVRDWKLLRTLSELRGQYLRQIPPSEYAAIFKQALEESTLVEILRVAESLPAAEIGSHLRGLSQVQRVDMLVMFMGAADNKLLLSLLDRCEADGQDMSDVKKRVGV